MRPGRARLPLAFLLPAQEQLSVAGRRDGAQRSHSAKHDVPTDSVASCKSANRLLIRRVGELRFHIVARYQERGREAIAKRLDVLRAAANPFFGHTNTRGGQQEMRIFVE